MSSRVKVEILAADEWPRLKDLRLRSLRESPEAFGGTFEVESAFTESDWRSKFSKLDYLAASIDEIDIAIMSVEVLDGDHGATCWIGGCWSDPKYRGQGALRALFEYLDSCAVEKGWQRQGLGVWADNDGAISAYRAIGFENPGFSQESERQPGRFYIHMVRDSVTK
ncbi:MAG: GNAT family N-acetyltransferase [Actinomycetes bacterium]|jgi:GNAT superfamily N-acetyltransferase